MSVTYWSWTCIPCESKWEFEVSGGDPDEVRREIDALTAEGVVPQCECGAAEWSGLQQRAEPTIRFGEIDV